MILLLKLAYRNVFRNFRRSLLTFLAISVGIALALIFIGFSVGLEQQSIKLAVDTRAGHVKIHKKDYLDDELTLTLDYTIDDYAEVLQKIKSAPETVSAAERILFPGSLTDGIDELRLTGIGYHPDRENEVFQLADKLQSGVYVNSGEEKMVLSNDLAALFSVKTGDYLTLIARTKYEAINALDLEIAGILNVGNPEIDKQCFFIPLDVAQEFLDMQNSVTEITAKGASMETADKMAERFRTELDGGSYEIVTWEYLTKDLIRLYEIRRKSRGLINFILFLMASVSVMNTMLMSIFERTNEIGTIMAMGLRKSKIMLLFIFEGMYLGVFGSFVGCLLGGSVTYYFKYNGINVTSFYEQGAGNLPIGKYMYTEITPYYILIVFLLGITIAILSAAYPAFKGAKLQPTEALRYV